MGNVKSLILAQLEDISNAKIRHRRISSCRVLFGCFGSWIIAINAPTNAPCDVPPTTSTGTPLSTIASYTPTWANPLKCGEWVVSGWVVVVESGGGEGQNVYQCMKRALEATVVANSGKQWQTNANKRKQAQTVATSATSHNSTTTASNSSVVNVPGPSTPQRQSRLCPHQPSSQPCHVAEW
jgi:hypothetical protein